MSLPRMETYLRFLAERLSAPDYAEAASLLHAAIDPVHASRRHGEAAPTGARRWGFAQGGGAPFGQGSLYRNPKS